MGGVIEHLYDPVATLREIFKILRPNGWFYFDAPNEDGLYMLAGNAYMKALGRDWVVTLAPTFSPYHVQGFNPTSLRKILEISKFRIREFRMFGEISAQTGKMTLRKSSEYAAARLVNWVGNKIGRGMYMDVWAQKAGL
jgi:2-polyprenyl-3-methyl-5-hydroxy-6-metoxy-1,4-benzoquinol methylase